MRYLSVERRFPARPVSLHAAFNGGLSDHYPCTRLTLLLPAYRDASEVPPPSVATISAGEIVADAMQLQNNQDNRTRE